MQGLQSHPKQDVHAAGTAGPACADLIAGTATARNKISRHRPSPGYTLVELLMVVAIVSVLANLAMSSYSRYIENVRIMNVVTEIRDIEKSIKTYELLRNEFPESLAAIGLDKLTDRWGNPYQYLRIQDSVDVKGKSGGRGSQRRDRNMNPVNTDYDLYSMGADGKTKAQFTAQDAKDDIVRANNGEYVGLASEH